MPVRLPVKRRLIAMGSYRVIRGGRWSNLTEEYRLGFHGYSAPGNQLETIGFRLVFVP